MKGHSYSDVMEGGVFDERRSWGSASIDRNSTPEALVMTIAAEDVRRLLDAGDTDAVLVLIEGHTEIVPAEELTSPAYRGALRVASREEVIARTGTADLSDHELEEQAENLDVAVRNLGG